MPEWSLQGKLDYKFLSAQVEFRQNEWFVFLAQDHDFTSNTQVIFKLKCKSYMYKGGFQIEMCTEVPDKKCWLHDH